MGSWAVNNLAALGTHHTKWVPRALSKPPHIPDCIGADPVGVATSATAGVKLGCKSMRAQVEGTSRAVLIKPKASNK